MKRPERGGLAFVAVVALALAILALPSAPAGTERVASAASSAGTAEPLTSINAATLPSAPLDVEAVPHPNALNITWFPPLSDGGANLTGYVVVWTPAGNTTGTATVGPGALHTWVGGLANYVAYNVEVAARNPVGLGPFSSPLALGVPGRTPSPPVNVSVTPGNGTATVNWTAPPPEPYYPVLDYRVNLTADNRSSFYSTAAHQIVLGNLTNGVPFRVAVSADNAVGAGTPSAQLPFTPLAPPGSPLDLTTSYDSAQRAITLSWTASGWTGGAEVTNFTVHWSGSDGTSGQAHVSGADRSWTLTESVSGVAYSFEVQAEGRGGTSLAATTAFTVPSTTVAAPPTVPTVLVLLEFLLIVGAVLAVLVAYDRSARRRRLRARPRTYGRPVAPYNAPFDPMGTIAPGPPPGYPSPPIDR